jgi:ABC-type multidrug transport system fused ATPase/permease subunit
MDRIIFMENGKIAEDGNFNELLAIKNGKFKELWEHQANDVLAR